MFSIHDLRKAYHGLPVARGCELVKNNGFPSLLCQGGGPVAESTSLKSQQNAASNR